MLEISSASAVHINDTIEVSSKSTYYEYAITDPLVTAMKTWKELNTLELYPNPAEDQLYLKLAPNTNSSSVEMYHVSGKLIAVNLVQVATGIDSNTYLLNVSALNEGVYFVRLADKDNGKTEVKRFVKK